MSYLIFSNPLAFICNSNLFKSFASLYNYLAILGSSVYSDLVDLPN